MMLKNEDIKLYCGKKGCITIHKAHYACEMTDAINPDHLEKVKSV